MREAWGGNGKQIEKHEKNVSLKGKRGSVSKYACFRGNAEYVDFWGACWTKTCSFRGHVENVECFGESLWTPPPYLLVLPPNSTYSRCSTFCGFKHILTQQASQNSTYSTFPWKKHIFSKNCFYQLKCWLCWILVSHSVQRVKTCNEIELVKDSNL